MDWISELPDELLLKILSSLPMKDVVVTMVLSKRWKFLWMLVPRVLYDHKMYEDGKKFSRFVYTTLLLHQAPVLRILLFKLGKNSCPTDIGVWVKSAVKRCVRRLAIDFDTPSVVTLVSLPWSLYTEGCRLLEVLNLTNMILVDTSSFPASFPSLISLRLVSVKYPNTEFLNKLISSCPVLKDLVVERCLDDNVTVVTIRSHSLKVLYLRASENGAPNKDHGFVIDAPSLEHLNICDQKGGFCVIENNIPHIVEADIDVTYCLPGKILSSITSVQRLLLCLTASSENTYPVGSIFSNLVHFELGTCETGWLNLLMCVLKDSPKLRTLKLEQCHNYKVEPPRPCWNEPSSVPECLSSSFETLKWVKYEGTKEEKELVVFILRNGSCLKKVIVSSKSTDPNKKLEMIKALSLSYRRSPTCILVFD